MDFDLSSEQQMLRDNVARLMKKKYGFEQRKAYLAAANGFSDDLWRAYADLGLLGAPFAEEDGGFGGGPVETMIAMEEFGKALALEPYLETVVLGGALVRHAAAPEQRADLIGRIAAGDLRLSFAHAERQSGFDLNDVGLTAKRDGAAFVLDGEKGLVVNGDSADALIVSARVAGGRRDRDGIGLFLVDAEAPGVSRRGYPTQDGRRAAEIAFANVRVAPDNVLGSPEDGLPAIERAVDETIAALAAEAVGAMSEALAMTVEYLKTRKQFGVTIGSFQALQHRASDMVVALEQARSMMYFATMSAADDDADERAKAISAAKVQIGRSAKFIGQQAVQMHGGIAMTYEYKVGHLFKRLTMIDGAFGDADLHLRRLGDRGSLFA
ncbi:pimeloyl-CoA dehydrogenase small subunit [Roseiarcus fermentans]|uniref:Pimeloyl-CoA dehydrogenase small subunit n=1 Tax=Roseiarcus fermentans TaxID=1473586 RepID=A0A366FRV1_9HYPH|nr:acyl-CoA dehydrogenase [Roseiarcus fermentans]RBP16465.1 pimeloyl-CoA dehydrogenase small subunit [Roseiarcus fermentans]